MGVIAPAMAEPQRVDTFPNAANNEFMQENKVYTNAATSTNMDSVYEGSVNAIAEYTEIPYSAAEGFYLTGVDNNNDAITAECTSGNFCPGVASTTYENNAFSDTGLQSCSTATSGAYTLSDAGASSSGQCYRTCDGHVSILHATGVTGNDYSDGTNTCSPTGCDNGYHPKAAVTAPNIGTGTFTGYAYINNSGSFSEYPTSHGQSYYGLTDKNTWAIVYGTNGILMGQARCSTQAGDNNNWAYTNPTITSNLTDETGQEGAQYCYCNVTGYKGTDGTLQSLSSPWVFAGNTSSALDCAVNCTGYCMDNMRSTNSNQLAFRAALLGAIESSPAMCEANTITINWNDVDPATAGQNNENTAVYGGDVRTPVKAQTKKGKTFKGWRFSAPTPISAGD